MKSNIIITFLAVGLLSGCSAVTQPTAMNQLQIKVSQLERKLEDRDEEVAVLKEEVEDLSSQLDSTDTHSFGSYIEEPVLSRSSVKTTSYNSKKTRSSSDIVRVNVSSQKIQTALKNSGYYKGSVDGKIGRGTKKAILTFQADHGLTTDGIIGKKSWTELEKYL